MRQAQTQLGDLKVMVAYSALGLGTATGLFLLVRHFYKKSRRMVAEKHSLIEGDPATFARQLKMAFDNDNWMGWGTNTELVMQVFESMPSRSSYQRVQSAYASLYNRSLTADLESELTSDEYNQVIRIISTKK